MSIPDGLAISLFSLASELTQQPDMAGGLRKDPAIEQFAHMRANTDQYFRVNRKSGPFLLITLGILPLAIGYLSYNTHGQLQLAGLRRGENSRREWPSWLQPLMEKSKPKDE